MSQFNVGSNSYVIGRLDALRQFDVARKLAPVLIFLGAGRKPDEPEPTPDKFARAFCAVAGGIPQTDSDEAMRLCLGVVSRVVQGGAAAAPVIAPFGGVMYQDIDLTEMLQLVGEVLRAHKLTSFFSELPVTSTMEPLKA
jgi:hypothetical protein